MGLGLRAERLAAQPHPRPHPQGGPDGGDRPSLTLIASTAEQGPPIPDDPRTSRPGPEGASCSRGRADCVQATVQPSASRSALWIAVAATAASAPATAIWFSPRTTSPAA